MNKKVNELHILSDNTNIFSNDCYVVPLYQRGYAWEEKHIVQLIDDVMDIDSNDQYYIGSLIVYKRDNEFEVIDGQQRLTTLYLLLKFLNVIHETETIAVRFDCRDKSNYTLKHIGGSEQIDDNRVQQELLSGYDIIKEKISNIDESLLKEKLSRTIIYRIEVPEHTDLNHYFEIMNTRGEQLEQSDILKAQLMGMLKNNKQWQSIFATIWDACRDMDGYVQMHFPKNVREELFGSYWNEIPSDNIKDYQALSVLNKQTEGHTMREAIAKNFAVDATELHKDYNHNVRFESIIDFSYFLLHTLRVFVHFKNIKAQNSLFSSMLDDKKLVDSFDSVISNGNINGKPINAQIFAKEFIVCLLRTRYLYDRYIIKREYIGDALQDGEWSLKEMYSQGQGGKKKAIYGLTKVVAEGCWYNESHNKEVMMLQAAMRVSYTSPKVMHWITKLLTWLTDCYLGRIAEGWIYEDFVNNIAKEPIIEFLNDEKNFYLGVSTPHIVLNYLDYLLWQQNKSIDFNFEFRNSIEHWYPRNPSEGSFARWDDEGVNRFGNLCLIQRNVNSKFSNMHPCAKKSTFQKMISKGSLKLREMSKLTTDNSQLWREETCSKHEETMLNLLRNACG